MSLVTHLDGIDKNGLESEINSLRNEVEQLKITLSNFMRNINDMLPNVIDKVNKHEYKLKDFKTKEEEFYDFCFSPD